MTAPSVSGNPNGDLPRWLWLWFPSLMLVVHAVALLFGEETYTLVMKSESSVVEIATFIVLVVAVGLGLLTLLQRKKVGGPLFTGWVLLMTLGCVYFAGEEASWGHHWGIHPFGEEVANQLIKTNNQDEPNLHNQPHLKRWLDKLPRTLLTLAALVGGILVPLWSRRRGPLRWPATWVWPTIVCLPTAVVAVTISLPRKLLAGLDVDYARAWRMGETKEYFLGLFLMLYLASLYVRVRKGRLGAGVGAGVPAAGGTEAS